jgi:hypothetical protein
MLGVGEGGQHHDNGRRDILLDGLQRLKAFALGHVHVQDHHVRLELSDGDQGGARVASLANDLCRSQIADQLFQALAHQG